MIRVGSDHVMGTGRIAEDEAEVPSRRHRPII